jgi:hypothetical protein
MRDAVMSPIGDWRNVKPVGDPIQLTFDQPEDERDNAGMIFDEFCREIEHTIDMQVVEAFRAAKLDPRHYLDARNVFSLMTKTVVERVTYPRTVREAKARPKGNRGNRRRVHGFVGVYVTMPVARMVGALCP